MFSIAEKLYPALERRAQSLSERNLLAELFERDADLTECRDQIASLTEELESERVKLRISQLEVEQLAAVNVRNIERIRSEAKVTA